MVGLGYTCVAAAPCDARSLASSALFGRTLQCRRAVVMELCKAAESLKAPAMRSREQSLHHRFFSPRPAASTTPALPLCRPEIRNRPWSLARRTARWLPEPALCLMLRLRSPQPAGCRRRTRGPDCLGDRGPDQTIVLREFIGLWLAEMLLDTGRYVPGAPGAAVRSPRNRWRDVALEDRVRQTIRGSGPAVPAHQRLDPGVTRCVLQRWLGVRHRPCSRGRRGVLPRPIGGGRGLVASRAVRGMWLWTTTAAGTRIPGLHFRRRRPPRHADPPHSR